MYANRAFVAEWLGNFLDDLFVTDRLDMRGNSRLLYSCSGLLRCVT